jgi:phosphorylcholine metabolism protein LicD
MGASDNLRASKVAFDTLNVNFFLAEGSLLGWYRNCMPIPWDTDLDLVSD